MNTNGFYRLYDQELQYSPNFVSGAEYDLTYELKDRYTYPVFGWYWFDSLEDCCNFFDLNVDDYSDLVDQKQTNVKEYEFYQKVSEGYDTGFGFKLALGDKDRNQFTQMLVLVTTALSVGAIQLATPQTIADKEGNPHQLSTQQFIGLMLQYGQYYKQLWDQLKTN